METETENARIAKTFFGIEGHGLLSASIQIEGGSWTQGYGGYNLGTHGPHNYAARFVKGLIEAVGVESWEALPRQCCRVRRENGQIVAIGHIIEDRWFCYRDIVKDLESK